MPFKMAISVDSHAMNHHDTWMSHGPKGHDKSVSILDLPANLLEAVFIEAGICTQTNINLAASAIPPIPTEFSPDDIETNAVLIELGSSPQKVPYDHYDQVRPKAHLTLSLMLTCGLFYRQTVATLCNKGNILLSMRTVPDFDKALHLSGIWFENFKVLTVGLSGPYGRCTTCLPPRDHSHGCHRPLALGRKDDKVWLSLGCALPGAILMTKQLYMDRWHAVWTQAFQCRLPATAGLSLQIFGHVADEQTAYALLQPLLQSKRRLLGHCSIRLIGLPESVNLRSLVANTVVSITSKQDNYQHGGEAFRFFDLPAEIRHNVLKYADLINPLQELQWWNRGSDWQPYPHEWLGPGDKTHLGGAHRDEQHGCIDQSDQYRRPRRGYFCRAKFIAASSRSSLRCSSSCWRFPIDLILASRRMYEEAMSVFFRYNKFVILPDEEDVKTSWKTLPARLPVSVFMSQHMTSDRSYWQNLRFLDIVLPCVTSASCCDEGGEGSNALQEWSDLLIAARSNLNLSQLTIQVTIARWWKQPDGLPIMQPEAFSESTYMACYACLLRPLSVLTGLARLYVLLPRIDENEAEYLYGKHLSEDEIISKRSRMERALENMIMGEGFDAEQAGKCLQTHSRWLQALHDQTYFRYLGD